MNAGPPLPPTKLPIPFPSLYRDSGPDILLLLNELRYAMDHGQFHYHFVEAAEPPDQRGWPTCFKGRRKHRSRNRDSALPMGVSAPNSSLKHQVQVSFLGKRHSIGSYKTIEVAGAIAQIIRQRHWGSYAPDPHPLRPGYDTAVMDLLVVLS